jgi:hypothetical protein
MTIPRAAASVLVLVATAVGIVIGDAVFRILAGG